MDDVTLGKLLTEAHRGQADCCDPEADQSIGFSLILCYNVIIQRGLFHHIYHIGCAFNLHSIINNGLIPRGLDSSRRQTVSSCPLIQETKDHEDPEHIDFSVPRRARYVHSAWKKHQDAVFWVDIDLAIRKD